MVKLKKLRTVTYHSEDEVVIVIRKDEYYKLAHPMEDIVLGETIADATQVMWCQVEQRWV